MTDGRGQGVDWVMHIDWLPECWLSLHTGDSLRKKENFNVMHRMVGEEERSTSTARPGQTRRDLLSEKKN